MLGPLQVIHRMAPILEVTGGSPHLHHIHSLLLRRELQRMSDKKCVSWFQPIVFDHVCDTMKRGRIGPKA